MKVYLSSNAYILKCMEKDIKFNSFFCILELLQWIINEIDAIIFRITQNFQK